VRAYVTNFGGDGVSVIDPARNRVMATIPLGKGPNQLAVSAHRRHVFMTLHEENAVAIVDAAERKVVKMVPVGRDPNGVAFMPDGNFALVSNTGANDASIIDVFGLSVISTVENGPSPKRLAVGAVAVADARRRGEIMYSFDDVVAGQLPEGWRIDATRPKDRLAEWAVVRDGKAPSAPMVLALTKVRDLSSGVFNLCWNPNVRFKDGEIEVSVRARSGRTDQGGGPIWRVRDSENYYVARYNPLERNFRLYYVKDGRRHELASAEGLDIGTGRWFTIRIAQTGSRMEGWIDGKKLLEVEDTTLPDAGGVGVWTKADAATAFDNLRIRAGGRS
jgi:YVTN family beta-propeller protein